MMVVKPHRLPCLLYEGGSMITKRIKDQSIHHHPMVIIVGRSPHYTIRRNDSRTKRQREKTAARIGGKTKGIGRKDIITHLLLNRI